MQIGFAYRIMANEMRAAGSKVEAIADDLLTELDAMRYHLTQHPLEKPRSRALHQAKRIEDKIESLNGIKAEIDSQAVEHNRVVAQFKKRVKDLERIVCTVSIEKERAISAANLANSSMSDLLDEWEHEGQQVTVEGAMEMVAATEKRSISEGGPEIDVEAKRKRETSDDEQVDSEEDIEKD